MDERRLEARQWESVMSRVSMKEFGWGDKWKRGRIFRYNGASINFSRALRTASIALPSIESRLSALQSFGRYWRHNARLYDTDIPKNISDGPTHIFRRPFASRRGSTEKTCLSLARKDMRYSSAPLMTELTVAKTTVSQARGGCRI